MPTRIIVHSALRIYRVCTPIWVIRRISSATGRDAVSWPCARVCAVVGKLLLKTVFYIILLYEWESVKNLNSKKKFNPFLPRASIGTYIVCILTKQWYYIYLYLYIRIILLAITRAAYIIYYTIYVVPATAAASIGAVFLIFSVGNPYLIIYINIIIYYMYIHCS